MPGNICALQVARIIRLLGRRFFWLDPDSFQGNLVHGIVGNKSGVNSRRRGGHGGRGQGDEDAGEQRLIHGFPYWRRAGDWLGGAYSWNSDLGMRDWVDGLM